MRFHDFFSVRRKKVLPSRFSGEGTVLIAQMVQMSNLAAKMPEIEEMIVFLKRHIDTQNRIVAKNGGVVHVFVGDAILAYWVRTNDDAEYVNRAFLTAEELLSTVSDEVDYRVSLGSGFLSGDFFEPINKFQVVGSAMTEADQLSRFAYPAHRAMLLTESTKSKLTRRYPTYEILGELPNHSQVLAAFQPA